MKGSRLERRVAEAIAGYEALPEDFRRRFETALAAAKEALSVSEEIKTLAPGLGRQFMECFMMALSDGKIGGNWTKVHEAIAAGAPRLYPAIERIIPRDDGLSDVGL